MARYRFLVADLKSGTILEEIPFSTVSYSRVLNRPGAFSATIGLRHPKATRANLAPGKTAVHVERDGVIVWSGIIWQGRAKASSSSLEVAGEGWWSYFRHRFIRTTKTYTQQDQLFIARDLITYAQAQTNGNVGLTVGTETSGVLRDRTYNDFERKNLGAAVEELAAVLGGFDFSIEPAWSGQTVAQTLKLHYPRRGTVTTLVFELGANLLEIDEEVDGARAANQIDAIGAGEGPAMLIASSADTAAQAEYPLLEDTEAAKDVSVLTTLQARADLVVKNRARPIDRLPMIVAYQANPDTTFGNYITGDTVTVRASAGWMSVNGAMRVQEIKVSVAQDGQETVGLSFVPESISL